MGPEALFKRWFLFKLPGDWHAQTIETTTGRGVPDVNVCHAGREYWLEFKADTPHLKLQPEQWAWLNRRRRVGGRVGILLRHKGLWQLWSIGENPIQIELSGGFVEVISPSAFSGETHESLLQAIKAL